MSVSITYPPDEISEVAEKPVDPESQAKAAAAAEKRAASREANVASAFAAMDIPSFACTPNLFPDLMAAAIQKQNISQWAATNGLSSERAMKAAP